MFVSLDWVSFTFDSRVGDGVPGHALAERLGDSLSREFPNFYGRHVMYHEWYPKHGRAPYHTGLQRDDGGVMIFGHGMLEHALVEIGGVGMDTCGGMEGELELLAEVQPRLTRLDVAVDIPCDVTPPEFTAHRSMKRFKSWSEAKSSSGHTVYVGSRTSDRYARVYRYNEPHPRAGLLRVEMVMKGQQAKQVASDIAAAGIINVAAALGDVFGWTHAVWSPAPDELMEIKAWRPERRHGKTVSWLYSQVIPAIVKLHLDGVIDARQVFADDILPLLDTRRNM